MARLKTYEEFVNEGIMDVIKAPIKYVKIKNNLKKYQKAKVKQALNDVDFAKRKAKGRDTMTDKQKEVLNQANKAKNAALADTTSAISQRMNDLATSPILKKVVSLGTTKARLAANDVVFKSADGEEKKKLKIKANALQKKASEVTGELKDYESTAAKKAEPAAKASQQNTDSIKTSTEEAPPKKSAADKKKDEERQKIGDKIGKAMEEIQKAEGSKKIAQDEKDKLAKKLSDVKGTDKEPAAAKEVAAAAKAVKDIDAAIEKLKGNIKDLQKQQKELKESFNYLNESVSQKFARLRNEM